MLFPSVLILFLSFRFLVYVLDLPLPHALARGQSDLFVCYDFSRIFFSSFASTLFTIFPYQASTTRGARIYSRSQTPAESRLSNSRLLSIVLLGTSPEKLINVSPSFLQRTSTPCYEDPLPGFACSRV